MEPTEHSDQAASTAHETTPTEAAGKATDAAGQTAAGQKTLDAAPAAERIQALFDEMPTRREILFGILDFASAPRTPEEMAEQVAKLEAHNRSVFSSTSYVHQLAWAGALEAVDETGASFDDEAKKEPEIVEVDGMRYLKPAEPPQKFWVLTDAGKTYLEQDDPMGRMKSLFDENERYAPIYQTILDLCSADGGCKITAINDAVNGNELLRKPHYFAPHFVEQLEKCRALEFEGAWTITSIGKQGLEMLAEKQAA